MIRYHLPKLIASAGVATEWTAYFTAEHLASAVALIMTTGTAILTWWLSERARIAEAGRVEAARQHEFDRDLAQRDFLAALTFDRNQRVLADDRRSDASVAAIAAAESRVPSSSASATGPPGSP